MLRKIISEAVERDESMSYTRWVKREKHETPYSTQTMATYCLENPDVDLHSLAAHFNLNPGDVEVDLQRQEHEKTVTGEGVYRQF